MKGRRINKLRALASMIRAGESPEVTRRLRRWLYSDSISYGLRRDLTRPFEAPSARIPLTVRPLKEGEELALLDVHAPNLTGRAIFERTSRLELIAAGIPTCYVAVTADDTPCYMQFQIRSSENARIRSYFGSFFPWLAPDEALAEGALTLEAYQGLGIMSCAVARIAERAPDVGARWVITFVDRRNVTAVKGCERAGFSRYLLRHERWRMFRRQVSFQELPTESPQAWKDRLVTTR